MSWHVQSQKLQSLMPDKKSGRKQWCGYLKHFSIVIKDNLTLFWIDEKVFFPYRTDYELTTFLGWIMVCIFLKLNKQRHYFRICIQVSPVKRQCQFTIVWNVFWFFFHWLELGVLFHARDMPQITSLSPLSDPLKSSVEVTVSLDIGQCSSWNHKTV